MNRVKRNINDLRDHILSRCLEPLNQRRQVRVPKQSIIQSQTHTPAFEPLIENKAFSISWQTVRMMHNRQRLDKIADILGRNRPAREIEPDEITAVIRPIYKRGAKSMADHVRSYIRSAFSWGIKTEHDFRSTSPRRFKLPVNPAAGISAADGTASRESRVLKMPQATFSQLVAEKSFDVT